MANYWQMQLHPGNPDWDLEEVDNILLNYSVIGMGEEWENDGRVPDQFKHNVHKGDIVIIRHQGEPRYLVEVIGECTKNEGNNKIDVWFDIYRKVKILNNEGPHYKSKYAQEKGRSWTDGLYAPTTFQTANNWDFAKYWYNDILKRINMEQYKTLLTRNYNLILTGAPGTGKTYLTKQIAAQMILGKEYDEKTASEEEKEKMKKQYDFVQFHPSYDYTDFMEGLRPIDNNGNISFRREDGIFMKFCRKALNAYNKAENKDEAPKYVFVIDEINRGDLSKIFGELFFSIDPGYRGEKGKVKTQYCNLWKTEKFGDSDSFYIPENVYIIGTMNDIDRSVESMDFAMRRRFAFKEVRVEDRMEMINERTQLEPFFWEINDRMTNLNYAILTIQGLSTAYQIGAAYFLKLENYLTSDKKLEADSWKSLWDNHLYGLLFEYLRGLPNAEEDLGTLYRAYTLEDKYRMENKKALKLPSQDA
ncbi:MAG: AAA family ATPase [Prevotella sp.]|nr:AAA family ATPase [Prevotella sp.]